MFSDALQKFENELNDGRTASVTAIRSVHVWWNYLNVSRRGK